MKAIIIGLDGVTWDVIDDHVLDNFMPNLKQLKMTGTWGTLESTIPAMTPAAWTTSTSGCMPYTHRLANFHHYNFKENIIYYTNSSAVKVPSMWHYLGENNYRVASINVPSTFPAYPINGVMISGLGCPDITCDFVYPPEFKEKLLQEVPDYKISLGLEGMNKRHKGLGATKEVFQNSLDKIYHRFLCRLEAARLIQKDHPVDIMMVQFQQFDLMQHLCWPYMDANRRDEFGWYRDQIFLLYQKFDKIIGELVEMCNEDGLVTVLSDHGFGPNPFRINANILLCQWGYIQRAGTINRMIRRSRRNLMKLQSNKHPTMTVDMKEPVNWSKTQAMVLLRPTHGALFLNIKGRQPGGCVELNQKEATLDELKKRFSDVTNPFNGEKVFNQVVTPKELWGKEDIDEIFGDLILLQKPNYRMCVSMKKGREAIEQNPKDSLSSSWHYPNGLYILRGKNIKKDHMVDAHIADLAPTLYSWLSMPIPAEVDGKAIQGAFVESSEIIQNQQIQFPESFVNQETPTNITQQEQEQLAQQLKDLGYM